MRPAPPPLKPYKFIGVPSFTGPNPAKYTIPPPPPVPPPPPPASLEERVALVQKRLAKQDEAFRRRYLESFDMSWIYHDSALEGVVYTLRGADARRIDPSAAVVHRLEHAADLRGDPPSPRGDRVRPRLRDEEAPADHDRRR